MLVTTGLLQIWPKYIRKFWIRISYGIKSWTPFLQILGQRSKNDWRSNVTAMPTPMDLLVLLKGHLYYGCVERFIAMIS